MPLKTIAPRSPFLPTPAAQPAWVRPVYSEDSNENLVTKTKQRQPPSHPVSGGRDEGETIAITLSAIQILRHEGDFAA